MDFYNKEEMIEKKLLLINIISSFEDGIETEELINFTIKNDLMNYFSLMKYIKELCEKSLIAKSGNLYGITVEGSKYMNALNDILPQETLEHIKEMTANAKARKKVISYSFNGDDITLVMTFDSKDELERAKIKWQLHSKSIENGIIELLKG